MMRRTQFTTAGPPLFYEIKSLDIETSAVTESSPAGGVVNGRDKRLERRQKQKAKKKFMKALENGSISTEHLHSLKAEARDGDVGIGPPCSSIPLPPTLGQASEVQEPKHL